MNIALYIPALQDRNTTPLLGPLYLLAVLEKKGFEARLFDARIEKNALHKMAEYKPDLVGISAVTAGYNSGLFAAEFIKSVFPGIPVVFGGPHPSSLSDEVIRHRAVDGVLIGESEDTFVELCRRFRDKRTDRQSLMEIPNAVFKAGGETISTKRRDYLLDLDTLPFPAFHRMNLDAYFSGTQAHGLFNRGQRILTIMSTRGCPFHCTFCGNAMGRKLRSRSIDSVMAEIRFLADTYGIDEIYFEDDNFTAQRERALAILDRLAGFKPSLFVKFANGIRADLVDREMLEAMKKARVYSLSFGIESGYEATLVKMNKQLSLEKARENIFLAKEMGFLVGSNCIIGYPGETVADINRSLEYFNALPLDSMAIVNLVPFPGTEVRNLCEKEGYLTEEAQCWDNYYFSIANPIPLIATPVLSKAELRAAIRRAYRQMYLRPGWIIANLKNISLKKIIAGIFMLFGRPRVPAKKA